MLEKRESTNKIAIIGMSTRFPDANNYNEFWQNLRAGKNSVKEIPSDRWNIEQYYSENINESNKSISKWCGILDDIALFDTLFFNILPREACSMDPQQRILLEETWKCIEDAAVSIEELQAGRTGVYTGIFNMDYKNKIVESNRVVDYYEGINNFENHIANRISYQFDFNGPSMAINTACSSGLVSIIQAVRGLQAGECQYALASGVNLNIDPYKYIAFSKYRMLSPDGQCRTFDKNANGYVPGDGAGVFLLQRLEDAERDGNHIYGVIIGSAIGHTGRGYTLTAPNVESQMEVIKWAYEEADVDLRTINYIEAHGTGTSLGDPIELEALNNVFNDVTDKKKFCKIGSVKTNIGHLESAAGIASVAKVLLMFQNKEIPPTINLEQVNPVIDFDNLALEPAWKLMDWKKEIEGEPRRAGVSSFGFGGTNAHILLEEYEKKTDSKQENEEEEQSVFYIFNLSAKSSKSLKRQLEQWKRYINTEEFATEKLSTLCLNLLKGRESFKYRCGRIVEKKEDIIKFLNSLEDNIKIKKVNNGINISRNREYIGYVEVKNDCERFPKVKNYIEKMIPDKITEFERNKWNEKQVKVFSLVMNLAILQTLSDYGMRIEYINGSGNATLLSMVYAGILSIEDAMACIANNKKFDDCKMSRPRINYYDSNSRKYIYPLNINMEYLQYVADIEMGEEIEAYLDKGRELICNQYTFKRFVGEWEVAFNTIFGQSIKEALMNRVDILDEKSLQKKRVLLAIIVANSLRRVNLKWSLKEVRLVKNEKFYEILDLITDEILTKQTVSNLICNQNIIFEDIVSRIKYHQKKLNASNGKYKILQKFNTNLSEIPSLQEWIDQCSVIHIEDPDLATISFGNILNMLEYAWLQGFDVDWRKVFSEVKYKKIALPTYCFDQKYYWLSSNTEKITKVKEDTTVNVKENGIFQYTWNIKDNYQALEDHKIENNNIVPGAAMVSIVHDCLTSMLGQKQYEMVSISFLNVARKGEYIVNIDKNKGNFFITKDKEKIFTGNFKTVQKMESVEQVQIPMNDRKIDTTECYNFFLQRGYDYKKSLQVIKKLGINNRKYIYKLQVGAESQFKTISEYLLDGVFQSILYTYYQNNREVTKLLIPFLISEIKVRKELKNTCYVYVDAGKIRVFGSDIMASASVYDEKDELILEIRDMLFKRPEEHFIEEKKLNFYETVWVKEWIDMKPTKEEGIVAITFLNDDKFSNRFHQEISELYNNIIVVKKGEDYYKVFDLINKQNQSKSYDIYYLWSLNSVKESGIEQEIENGVVALYKIFKGSLLKLDKAKIRIMSVTKDCYAIVEQDKGINYAYGALNGFSRSLMKEMNRYCMKIIDLDETSMEQKYIISLLKTEMSNNQKLLIGYRNGSRFVQKVQSKEIKSECEKTVFEDNKQYIIVGGMGGIGRKIISKITKNTNSHIIVIGRKKREELNDIADCLIRESKIEYYSCNISDYYSIKNCIDEIKQEYGSIHGIIHAAGIVEDQYLINKQLDSFKKVLSPKILGAYYLNELTKDEALDFFIVFSSIVSIVGNSGQADYAAANSFLDALIQYRQKNKFHGKSIGINWTLWTNGGMGRAKSIEQNFKKRFGTIDDKAAMKGLETIMKQDSGQYIVSDNSDAFDNTIHAEELDKIEKDEEKQIKKAENKIMELLKLKLLSLLADVIQVSQDELDDHTDLREYGLESIMLSNFSERISELLHASISPTIFYEYSTIVELSEYLKDNFDLSTIMLVEEPQRKSSDIYKVVSKILSNILKVEENEIDGSTDLIEFGMDPVLFKQFAESINIQYNMWMNEKEFEQHRTLDEVVKYIDEKSVSVKSNSESTFESNDYENDIAIIGVSARFPKASNVEEFYENLLKGVDSVVEIPKERWNWKELEGDPLIDKNKTYSKWGGFLKDINQFDAEFFKISPHEASLMDPQQRLLLEEVWHTLEDADYKISDIEETDTGMFVGVCNSDYNQLLIEQDIKFDAYTSTGTYFSILPNRVSYLLNIHGPSIAIDTACSSSLVAMYQAVNAMKSGDCSLAFVAGVNVNCTPRNYIAFGNAGMLSKEGKCKTFDDSADGYVRGEGVGVVLLKPLKKAVEDNDNIYGVIKGVAVNHGGYANSLTAPNVKAQTAVIKKAYKRANVDVSTVSYIEAHGTGTSLGDPIEIESLKKAFEDGKYSKTNYCGIGSVKTNIGHLESASGIAGVIKILMMMKYGKMVKSLHLKNQNKYINIENSPFYFVNDSRDWQHNIDESGVILPYRAGVSSFGFGGTNSHVVLEEYIDNKETNDQLDKEKIIILSAKSNKALNEYAKSLYDYLKENKAKKLNLNNISYSLIVGREAMEVRLAIIAKDMQDLIRKLEYYCQNNKAGNDTYTGVVSNKGQDNKVVINSKEATYSMIANAWVTGQTINWDGLSDACRISLPSYPFQKKSYWVPKKELRIDTRTVDKDCKICYYSGKMVPSQYQDKSEMKLNKRTIIFCENESDWITYIEKNELKGSVVLVTFNPYVQKVRDYLYLLKVDEETCWLELIDWLDRSAFIPEVIIYCEDGYSHVEKPESKDWKSLFTVFKKFVSIYKDHKIYFTYNYLSDNNSELSFKGAVSGFMKSLGKEEPGIHMKVVKYNKEDYNCKTIVQECLMDWHYEVAYQNGSRLIRKMDRIHPSLVTKNKKVFRDGGVYLITGGFGGLGYQIANRIVSSVHATVILVGRSELDTQKQEQLILLRNKGSQVTYFQVDVTKKDSIKSLLNNVKSKYGSISGLIHCAGIVNDQYFSQKRIDEMEKVIAPKIKGAIYLDEVLKDEPLDFFVMFSSLVGEVGNAGQCDYAYANSFLNHFANYRNELCKRERRRGHTISIAWPFWLEGGMKISKDQLESIAKVTGKGITMEAGLDSLETLLQTELVTCSVTNIENEHEISFNLQQEVNEVLGSKCTSSNHNINDFVENEVKNIFSAILEIPVNQINSEVSFRDYGVDSIMINHFNELSEKKFGKLSKTLLYECSTISELVKYLIKTKGKDLMNTRSESEIPDFKKSSNMKCEEIAIIGVSGQYAMAENVEQYWDNLLEERDCISEIPKSRWTIEDYYDEHLDMALEGKMYSKWGGFIKDVDKFDPLFFGISPKEAESMDPQERIFIEEVYRALEDAGINKERLNTYTNANGGTNIGVFVGATTNTYSLWGPSGLKNNTYVVPNTFYWSIANRVSYLFDFSGPSLTVDTACSSSLTAVHLACESLLKNESEMAIVGGVNLYLHPIKYIQLCQMRMLSPTGKCHSYGDNADGFVPGEGVGAIVLKRLSDAKKDHDRIYAVIKGTAINHDGSMNGYTVPNPNAQAQVVQNALKNANLKSSMINYVEGHGTGTKLGDPIEVAGLVKAFNNDSIGEKRMCSLGSVKSNIGHLEAAAGIASITKVLLQMKHRKLVPTLHCKELNSNIYFEDIPFYVQRTLEDWKQPEIGVNESEDNLRRALVNGFGAGGTNVSIVLEEYKEEVAENSGENQEEVLVLSAENKKTLRKYAKEMARYIMKHKDITIKQIAFTLRTGRNILSEKLAFIASDRTAAAKLLLDYSNGKAINECVFTSDDFDLVNCNLASNHKKQVEAFMNGEIYSNEVPLQKNDLRIVSLAPYPFDNKSYWFNSFKPKSLKEERANEGTEDIKSYACEEQIEYETSEVKMDIIDGNIAVIRMENRENKNLFTTNMHLGLWDKINKINKQDDIKAVVLTGYDNLFCMGGTDTQLTSIATRKSNCSEMSFVYKGLLKCNVPVISAIQGHALGGGFVLGMFADIIVMSKESIYSTNFIKYGFTPGVGSTYILKDRLGGTLANEMMFTAKSFTGAELQKRGASFIFENQEEVLPKAISIARMLSKKPIETLVELKKELALRVLQVIPKIIESEVRMHNNVFSKIDVSNLIEHYFNANFEKIAREEKKSERKLVLKNKDSMPVKIKHDNKKLKLRIAKKQETSEINKEDNKSSEIKDSIYSILSEKLHIPIQDISTNQLFRDLGVDSISAVEIIRDLNEQWNLCMDAASMFNYPNIETLSEFICTEQKREHSDRIDHYDPDDYSKFFSSKTLKNPQKEELKNSEQHLVKVRENNHDDVQLRVIEILRNTLHINKEDIDMKKSLNSYGLDSINVIEIVNKINKEFLLNEETISVYDHPTLEELVEYIKKQIKSKGSKKQNINAIARKNFGASAEVNSAWFHSVNKEQIQETNKDKKLENVLNKFKKGDMDIKEVELYLEDLL